MIHSYIRINFFLYKSAWNNFTIKSSMSLSLNYNFFFKMWKWKLEPKYLYKFSTGISRPSYWMIQKTILASLKTNIYSFYCMNKHKYQQFKTKSSWNPYGYTQPWMASIKLLFLVLYTSCLHIKGYEFPHLGELASTESYLVKGRLPWWLNIEREDFFAD